MRADHITPPVVFLQRVDIPHPEKLLPARMQHPTFGGAMIGDTIELPGPLMPEGAELWPKDGVWGVVGKKWGAPITLKEAGCIVVLAIQFIKSTAPSPLSETAEEIPFPSRQS